MIKKLKNLSNTSPLIKDFRNYMVGDFFTKILSFISIAVFTRILTVEDYGIFGVFNASIGLLLAVITLGFHTAVSRYFFEHRSDLNSFMFISMVGSIFISTLFFSILWFYKEILADTLNLPVSLIIFFYPAIIIGIVHSIFSQYYSSIRESAFLTKVELFRAYAGFVISLLLVLTIEKSYLGLIGGSLIIGGLTGLYMFYKLQILMLPSWRRTHLLYIVSFSIPLIPYHASSLILQQFDRIMINTQLGNYESGLFNFAANIAMLYLVFTAIVLRAFATDYFNLMNEKNYNELDSKILKIFHIYVAIAVFLIFYGSEIATVLADEKFFKAISVVPILIMGYLFFSIYEIYGRNAVYAHKTIYASINILIPGILNIWLNAHLIPLYGNIGAASATLISYCLMAILGFIISKYIIRVHSFPLIKLVKPLAAFILSIGFFYSVTDFFSSFWVVFLIKSAFFLFLGIYTLKKIGFRYANT